MRSRRAKVIPTFPANSAGKYEPRPDARKLVVVAVQLRWAANASAKAAIAIMSELAFMPTYIDGRFANLQEKSCTACALLAVLPT